MERAEHDENTGLEFMKTGGREFIAAIKESQSLGCKIVYGSLDIKKIHEEIPKRLDFSSFLLPAKIGFRMLSDLKFASAVRSLISGLPTREEMTLINKYAKTDAPQLYNLIVSYRDEIIYSDIKPHLQKNEIVVVVAGIGHMDGLEEHLIHDELSDQ